MDVVGVLLNSYKIRKQMTFVAGDFSAHGQRPADCTAALACIHKQVHTTIQLLLSAERFEKKYFSFSETISANQS